MIFLGWNRPLLHATADWLLDSVHVPATPDLSGLVVVVRGRRAGRRLLELLALKCSEQGTILIPPEIVTPTQMVFRLTQSLPREPQEAGPLACALAWAEAIGSAPDSDRATLFRRPGNEERGPGLRTLLGLGRHLNQIWKELGGNGLGFRDVIKVLGEHFPNIADFEIPRWEVLESLHRKAEKILETHGLQDPTDRLISRARGGEPIPGFRVILVGVVEMPGVVRDFLGRLSEPPTALVFAPETEREGFDEFGIIRANHWKNRSAGLDAGQIHLVERDRDQALRAAQIVETWRNSGVAPARMTVAVPDVQALPRLREALEIGQMKTRWAQGRPASDAPAFQLLRLVAEYLDHGPDEPPHYEAVAALARHPDLPGIGPADWSALDRFAATHLPARFEPGSVNETSEWVRKIQNVLSRFVDISSEEISPARAADWTLEFLRRIYGGREENSLSPEGRVAVHALELLRDVVVGTGRGLLPWPRRVRPADFLHGILGFLGDQPVPEPPAADAVEIVGWLELIEDDAPAVVVTSLFEGAVPESVSSDPFLPGSLRQALALSDNDLRLARDAYALAAMVESRSQGRGGLALIAPRFDAADNPVRPSRLLLAGLHGEELARRVWHLAGRRKAEPPLPLAGGPGFFAAVPGDHPPVERVRVTAFRDYIESPRKFYFLHVLGLKPEDDAAPELQSRDVGTLVHEVLASFGADSRMRDSSDEEAIRAYVCNTFAEIIRNRFGPWAQPAVEIQAGEIQRRLAGFARAQAALRREGWSIRYVEGTTRLECELQAQGIPAALKVTGKVDRIDCDPSGQKWRIIDYKTYAKKREPLREHRRGRSGGGEWRDLQLPLYLKLAAPYARAEWGVELTPENCELVYFLLPEEEETSGISAAFPPDMVEEGWGKASELAAKILRDEFADNPPLRPDRQDPALLALCGQAGIRASEPADNLEI
jgi:ATP-dependent helicase/nuclease subunit B